MLPKSSDLEVSNIEAKDAEALGFGPLLPAATGFDSEDGPISWHVHPDGRVEGGLFDPEYYRYPDDLFGGTWADGLKAIDEFEWGSASPSAQHSEQDEPSADASSNRAFVAPAPTLNESGKNENFHSFNGRENEGVKPAEEILSEVEVRNGKEAQTQHVRSAAVVTLNTKATDTLEMTVETFRGQLWNQTPRDGTNALTSTTPSISDQGTSSSRQETPASLDAMPAKSIEELTSEDNCELAEFTMTAQGGSRPQDTLGLTTISVDDTSITRTNNSSVRNVAARSLSQDLELLLAEANTNVDTEADDMEIDTGPLVAMDKTEPIRDESHLFLEEHIPQSECGDVVDGGNKIQEGNLYGGDASTGELPHEEQSLVPAPLTQAMGGNECYDSWPLGEAPGETRSENTILEPPNRSDIPVKNGPVVWQGADSAVGLPSTQHSHLAETVIDPWPYMDQATLDISNSESNTFGQPPTFAEDSVGYPQALQGFSTIPPLPLDATLSSMDVSPQQAMYFYPETGIPPRSAARESRAEAQAEMSYGVPAYEDDSCPFISESDALQLPLQPGNAHYEPGEIEQVNKPSESEPPPMLAGTEEAAAVAPSTSSMEASAWPENHSALTVDLLPFNPIPPTVGTAVVDSATERFSLEHDTIPDEPLHITEALARMTLCDHADSDRIVQSRPDDATTPTDSPVIPQSEIADIALNLGRPPKTAIPTKRTKSGASKASGITEAKILFKPIESSCSESEVPKKKKKPNTPAKVTIKVNAELDKETTTLSTAANSKIVKLVVPSLKLQSNDKMVDGENLVDHQHGEIAHDIPEPSTTVDSNPRENEPKSASTSRHPLELSYGKRHTRADTKYEQRKTESEASSTGSKLLQLHPVAPSKLPVYVEQGARPPVTEKPKQAATRKANPKTTRSKRAKAPSDAYTDSEDGDEEQGSSENTPPDMKMQVLQTNEPEPTPAPTRARNTRAKPAATRRSTPKPAASVGRPTAAKNTPKATASSATPAAASNTPNKYGFKPRKPRVVKGKAKAKGSDAGTDAGSALGVGTQQHGEGSMTMRQTRRATAVQEQLEREAEKQRNIGLRLRSGDAKRTK